MNLLKRIFGKKPKAPAETVTLAQDIMSKEEATARVKAKMKEIMARKAKELEDELSQAPTLPTVTISDSEVVHGSISADSITYGTITAPLYINDVFGNPVKIPDNDTFSKLNKILFNFDVALEGAKYYIGRDLKSHKYYGEQCRKLKQEAFEELTHLERIKGYDVKSGKLREFLDNYAGPDRNHIRGLVHHYIENKETARIPETTYNDPRPETDGSW